MPSRKILGCLEVRPGLTLSCMAARTSASGYRLPAPPVRAGGIKRILQGLPALGELPQAPVAS